MPRHAGSQVHKFGGTCVAAAERIKAAAQLVVEESAVQKLVVVSAMGSHPSSPVKVTDLLLNMVAKASKQDQAFLIDLAALQVPQCSTLCTVSSSLACLYTPAFRRIPQRTCSYACAMFCAFISPQVTNMTWQTDWINSAGKACRDGKAPVGRGEGAQCLCLKASG